MTIELFFYFLLKREKNYVIGKIDFFGKKCFFFCAAGAIFFFVVFFTIIFFTLNENEKNNSMVWSPLETLNHRPFPNLKSDCSLRLKVAQNGPKYCQNRSTLAQNGPKWLKMAQNDPKWLKIGPKKALDPKTLPIIPGTPLLGLFRAILSHYGPILSHFGPVWAYSGHFEEFGSGRGRPKPAARSKWLKIA